MGLEKIIHKITGKIDGTLGSIKGKVKGESKKKLLALKDKIPDENQLKQKLLGSVSKAKEKMCEPATKSKLEKIYKKLKKFLEGLRSKINKALGLLGKLKGMLDFLGKLLKIIGGVLIVIGILMTVLNIVIKIAKIVVKFLGGTMTGGLIDFLSRKIVQAEAFRDKWKGYVKVAKNWVTEKFKKYIKPVLKILGIAIAAIVAVLGIINFLISVLEMLYLMTIQKCAVEEEKLGADVVNDGGEGETPQQRKQRAKAVAGLIEASSPEEIMMRLARTGKQEYIHYIRNANFETIGYKRFLDEIGGTDTSMNTPYPTPTESPDQQEMKGHVNLKPGDKEVLPPKESDFEDIVRDINKA